jgi:alpha-tubulin suppressor-like RCC1 family protein
MKKNDNGTRRFLAVSIAFLLAVLVAACNSPESPGPGENLAPAKKPLYDVTYDGNGNTAGNVPVDTNKYVYKTDIITLPERGNLYKVGYAFTGWNTAADGKGAAYKPNDQFTMADKPMLIYAQWKEVFPKISAGEYFSTLLTDDGVLYATGYNGSGRLGIGDNNTTNKSEFTAIDNSITGKKAQSVFSGTDSSFAILEDMSAIGWGQGEWGKLGFNMDSGTFGRPRPVTSSTQSGGRLLGNILSISAGRYQTAVLNTKGEYWATGSKANGGLGINPEFDRLKQLEYVTDNVISLAAGRNYVLLIKKNGSLWVSGEAAYGKLGTGNTTNVPLLRENTALANTNEKVFAGKNNFSMVLKTDGRVMAAGYNASGQLGNGTTSNQELFLPVKVTATADLDEVAVVSLGENHSMILRKDGTLWAMGTNAELQLGVASTINRLYATRVLDDVAHVAAGYNHTLAVKEDGSLWAAGSNANGQFGQIPSGTNSTWTRIDINNIVNKPNP